MRPLPPLNTIEARAAEDIIFLDGMLVGASYEFINTVTGNLFTQYVAGFDRIRVHTAPFDETDTFGVTSNLCGNSGTLTPVEIIPEEVTEIELNHTRIVAPICPVSKTLRVRSTVATGTIIIYLNGDPIQQQPISGSTTTVNLLDTISLTDGDVLGVRHVLMDNGQPYLYGGISTTTVDSTENKLSIYGAQKYEDQLTGEPIFGFIRNAHMDAGPEIELQCCAHCKCTDCEESGYQCLVKDEVRTATAEIRLYGNVIDTVELIEDEIGYYRGHWNWLDPSTMSIAPEDLPASHEYEVKIIDSPCTDADKLGENFTVLIGKPQHSSPPEHIQLKVSDRFGHSETVENGGSNKSLTVNASTDIDIEAIGVDSMDGIKSIEIFSSNGGIDQPLIQTQSYPPLPNSVALDTHLDCLPYGSSTDIYAVAESWNGSSVTSPVITVTGGASGHDAPSISRVSPSSPEVDDLIRISGDHLIYESQQCLSYTTEIVFTSTAAPTRILTLNDTMAPGQSSPREIRELPFPADWQNLDLAGEEVCVQVKVTGNTTKSSNIKCFTIKEPCQPSGVTQIRLEKLTRYGYDMMIYRGDFIGPGYGCSPYKHVKVTAVENPAGMNLNCPLQVGAFLLDNYQYGFIPFHNAILPGQTEQGINGSFYQGANNAYWEARVYSTFCQDWHLLDRAILRLHWVEE